jgi:hypothetical protein
MAKAKPYLRDFFAEHVQIDRESPSGLSWRRYGGRQITGKGVDGYYRFQLGGTAWKAHRVVWCLIHGDVDSDMVVDHLDRDKENNRIENLELKTCSGNRKNRVTGRGRYARKRKERWEAHFTMPGTGAYVYVGTFATELEAHTAALARRLELHWVP